MVEQVYSLGGSIIRENLGKINQLTKALQKENKQILVVTGAGDLNKHQKAVKEKANKGEQDLLGIKATRLNAQTLVASMETYPKVPETPEEIKVAASSGKDVIMGGLVPGYSTDAVAATAAELLDAELFIPTTIEGVYSHHPENEKAEKLSEVNHQELLEIVEGNNEPGGYELIDETAVKIIERSKIPTKIFKGTIENLKNPENADGTKIVFDSVTS